MNDDIELFKQLREDEIFRARKGLLAFTVHTKPDYEINWHHRELCRVLNRFVKGEFRRLMVMLPPRVGKTELVSRRLPAFIHGINPFAEIMSATYNSELASAMAVDVQRILDSPEYREVFPNTLITPEGKKTNYTRNSHEYELIPYGKMKSSGTYRAQGVGGSFTGHGANFILIDDPCKNREEADSPAFREKLWNFYTSTLYTRLEKNGQILLTMTRWHEDDLAGRLIQQMKESKEADQWVIISFPAIKEDDDNPLDKRKIGEPLWESKYSKEVLENIRATVGSRDWASLYQQRPAVETGNIVQRQWLRFYDIPPSTFDEKVIFADLSFKEGPETDFTCIEAWGRKGTSIYLIDQVRGRMDFPAQINALRSICARHPDAFEKQIEEAANGAAIISLLKNEIFGLVPIKPHTSKQARLAVVSPLFEAGNVYYPTPNLAPWVENNIHELLTFPNAKHDDSVDCASMALMRLGKLGNSIERLKALTIR